jgi:phosphatidylglycerophosphate synthase
MAAMSYAKTADATDGPRIALNWNVLERAAFRLSHGDPTFQDRRDIIFYPFARVAVRMRLSANSISLLGVAFAIGSAVLVPEPLLASLLLSISLFLDGLDGVVARLTKTASVKGEVFDIFCDTAGVLSILTGLSFWGYLSFNHLGLFATVLIFYTVLSSFKSQQILGKYRSIGSRVVVTSYIALCLAIGQFQPSFLIDSSVMDYGISAISFVLVANLAWDLVSAILGIFYRKFRAS